MSTLRDAWQDQGCASAISTLFAALCLGAGAGVNKLAGPWWAGVIVAILVILGFVVWWALLRSSASPVPPTDLPYEVIDPSEILSHLPSLGKRTTGYVPRPETADLRSHPLELSPMILLVGPEASGKTRESAEIAMALAREFPTRTRVYLMKRPETPSEPPADLAQHIPILLFDDLDHPWRNQPEGDVTKATAILKRLPELLAWYSQNSYDGHCWIITNARREPLERVCERNECAAAAACLQRVDLDLVTESMARAYWRSALAAFGVSASDEIIVRLAQANAGGFRLPYEFLNRVVDDARTKLTEQDVEQFSQYQGERWRTAQRDLSPRQRDLLQALGDLASLGLPLFASGAVALCAARRSCQYRLPAWSRLWDAPRLTRGLRSLVRRYFMAGSGGRVLVHDSLLPTPTTSVPQLAPEVGALLLTRAARSRLSTLDISSLRESLAALDELLFGSSLLPLLVRTNRARAGLSLPARPRATHERESRTRFPDLTKTVSPEAGPAWAYLQLQLGIAYNELPVGERALNQQRAIACYQRALEVYTQEAFPTHWAGTLHNLGNAWRALPTGNRGGELAARHRLLPACACGLHQAGPSCRLGHGAAQLGGRVAELAHGEPGGEPAACYRLLPARAGDIHQRGFPNQVGGNAE